MSEPPDPPSTPPSEAAHSLSPGTDGGPVAFVLSSGANLGAAQVGMLRALLRHDVYPDLVVGASVGAINGAAFAEHPSLDGIARLEQVWRTLDPRDLLPRGRMVSAVALARRGEAVHPPDGLRQTVRRAFSSASFEDLKTPFQCVATDVVTAREAWFDSGPLAEAVLASTALPAVYPAVEIDGRRYVDGGVVVDVPIRRAAELGARTLYVLGLARLSRAWSEPRRPLDAAIEAYWVARRHRFQRDLESLPDGVTVHLLTDEVPPRLRFSDVAYTAELIESGNNMTAAYLDALATVRG